MHPSAEFKWGGDIMSKTQLEMLMNDVILKHEENAFKRELYALIDKKYHEFREQTGHRMDRISLDYIPKPENPTLTLGIENKGLFECYVYISES